MYMHNMEDFAGGSFPDLDVDTITRLQYGGNQSSGVESWYNSVENNYLNAEASKLSSWDAAAVYQNLTNWDESSSWTTPAWSGDVTGYDDWWNFDDITLGNGYQLTNDAAAAAGATESGGEKLDITWDMDKPITTFMLRNIPNKYCQKELLEDLEYMGFAPAKQIDFFYLPVDQETGANLGYAFVNLTSTESAELFRSLNGANFSRYATRKVIVVGVATVQGLMENWIFYQRSSAMRNSDPSRRPLFWPKVGSKIEATILKCAPIEEAQTIENRRTSSVSSSVGKKENKKDGKDKKAEEVHELPYDGYMVQNIQSGAGAIPTFENKAPVAPQKWISTLMLRNIRNKYGQKDILDEIEKFGFRPHIHIDFFYLPMDSTTGSNLGYAFMNFVSAKAAEDFQALNGKQSYLFKKKVLVVDKATVQGLQQNWDLYQRSSSMNSSDVSRRPCFWPQHTLHIRQEAYKPTSAEQVPKVPAYPTPDAAGRRKSKRSSSKDGVIQHDKSPESRPSDTDEEKLTADMWTGKIFKELDNGKDYERYPVRFDDVKIPDPADIPKTAVLDWVKTRPTSLPDTVLDEEGSVSPMSLHDWAKFCGNCGVRRKLSDRGDQSVPVMFCTECGLRFDQFQVEVDNSAWQLHQENSRRISGRTTSGNWCDFEERLSAPTNNSDQLMDEQFMGQLQTRWGHENPSYCELVSHSV